MALHHMADLIVIYRHYDNFLGHEALHNQPALHNGSVLTSVFPAEI